MIMCYCTPSIRTPFCKNCHSFITTMSDEPRRESRANQMTTDDKIREAFENKYGKRIDYSDGNAWDDALLAFIDGYRSALSSLEQTCWLKANGDAVYLDKPDEVFQYEPLYRIAPTKEGE